MSNQRQRWVLFAMVVSSACLSGGCALLLVGGAGAASYAYISGKCEKHYPYPLADTFAAARDAVESLELPVIAESHDALSGRIDSIMASGDKVVITFDSKGPSVTEVGVRVGVVGSEEKSNQIIARLDERLPGGIVPPRPDVHVGVTMSR